MTGPRNYHNDRSKNEDRKRFRENNVHAIAERFNIEKRSGYNFTYYNVKFRSIVATDIEYDG